MPSLMVIYQRNRKYLVSTFAQHFPNQHITIVSIERLRAEGGKYLLQASVDAIVSPESLCEEVRTLCADVFEVIVYPRTIENCQR